MILSIQKNRKPLSDVTIINDDLIGGGEILIGREADCHICLDSYQVSRYHASFKFEEGEIHLECLSEYGNIKVNGKECSKAVLSEGDKIDIGEYSITLNDLPIIEPEPEPEPEDPQESEDPLLSGSDESDMGGGLELGDDDLVPVMDEEPVETKEDETESEDSSLDISDGENDDGSDDDGSDDDGGFGLDLDDSSDGNAGESIDNLEENTDQDSIDFENETTQAFDGDLGGNELATDQDLSLDGGEDQSSGFDDNFGGDGFDDNMGGDDGGFDDGFGGGNSGGGSDDSGATQIFSTFTKYSLKITGEYRPFDRFSIEEGEVFIGRDPDVCKIVLDDSEVSKKHAKITRTKNSCIIEDLKSANGISYLASGMSSSERINSADLLHGDEFKIGETTFTVEVSSDLIEGEKDILMPVAENQEIEVEEIVEEEVDFGGEGAGEFGEVEEEKSLFKQIMNDPKKKRLAIIAAVLIGVLLMLPDEKASNTVKKGKGKKGEQQVTQVDPVQKGALQKNFDGGMKLLDEGKVDESKEYFEAVIKQMDDEGIKDDNGPKDKDGDVVKVRNLYRIIEAITESFTVAEAKFFEGDLVGAKEAIDIVMTELSREGAKVTKYKSASTLLKLIDEGLDKSRKLREAQKDKEEEIKRKAVIAGLVEEARKAVAERNVTKAKSLFNQIYDKEPENLDVPPLKAEIDEYVAEKERIKQEEAIKIARRKGMEEKLIPGRSLYQKNDWYRAIVALEKFLTIKDMDKDLVDEGVNMLKEAKRNLLLSTNPLLSKARSFKEGQDLKQAYETYGEVLKYDPGNEEAVNERDAIFNTLENRSKKIYREALVAESLSLFNKAKEKFQEVQQISPINSEYYNKATDKLEDYLE